MRISDWSSDVCSSDLSSGTGSIAGCAPTPTPSPTPTPTPTPTPNTPPIAVNDSKSVTCQQYVTHNLTANDSDLDGDLPLTITALSRISGSATATIEIGIAHV